MGDNDIPCRVSADLRRHLRAQELAEKFAEKFDVYDDTHWAQIFPARRGLDALVGPISSLVMTLEQSGHFQSKEQLAEDYERGVRELLAACQRLWDEC